MNLFIQRYLNTIDVRSFIVCIDFGVAANDRRFTPPATIRITGLSGNRLYMLVSNIYYGYSYFISRVVSDCGSIEYDGMARGGVSIQIDNKFIGDHFS